MVDNNKEDDVIGSLIPDVRIEKITLETTSASEEDRLMVNLNLIMKEQVTDDLVGTWFSSKEMGKYLNLTVYQSTSAKITSLITSGNDAFELIDNTILVSDKDTRMSVAAIALGVDSIEEVYRLINDNVKVRKISVKKDIDGTDSKLTQYKSRTGENGNEVYDITYNLKFELLGEKPEHLSYFAVTKIDLAAMAIDFGFDVDSTRLAGKLASEIVIEDFDIVARTFVFHNDGAIWKGAVYKDGQQWMSGTPSSSNSIKLERSVVTNTKIQDFRNIKKVEKLEIDFSILEKAANRNNLIKRQSNDEVFQKQETSLFSDMMLARDKDGDAKFFFSVDMEKVIIENTLFGRLIEKTPRLREELIKGSQIRSLRVLRQRIKENGCLASSGTPVGIAPFSDNEPLELIINSGESSWKSFSPVNNKVGSLKEVELIKSEEFFGVRHFTGMDKTMSDVTDGLYRYVIELDIDDATVEIIESKINNLLLAKSELTSYYSLCSKTSMSKYLAEVRDPHIEKPDEQAVTKGVTAGNYDIVSNRFTQFFIEKMQKRYKGKDRMSAPWIAPIVVYADILDIFTDHISDRKNRYQLLNALYSFASPTTGNPQGVAAVMGMIDDLASSLGRLVGAVTSTSPKKFLSGSSQMAGTSLRSAPKKTFFLQKHFTQIFDSEVMKGIGIDYLSLGEDETGNDDGIRTLSGDAFSGRVDAETLRFFKTAQPDINISAQGKEITKGDSIRGASFAFLMPARFDTMTKSFVVLNSNGANNSSPKKTKKKRFVQRMNEGEVSESDISQQLYSMMAATKASETPIKLPAKSDPIKGNRAASLGAMANAVAGFSVSIDKVRVEAIKDDDDYTLLKAQKLLTLLPAATTLCQMPDTMPASAVSEEGRTEEQETEALLPFYSLLASPAIQNGTADVSKRTSRRANRRTRRAPQASVENKRAPFEAVANVNNLKVLTANDGTTMIRGLNKAVTMEQFKEFPNQVKAMFLQSGGSSLVNDERYANIDSSVITGKIKSTIEIDLTYKMINKVDFLDGYEKDVDGNLLIQAPIWSTLTNDKYDLMVGQGILCRMRPYREDALGLKRNKGLSYATYDEYFVLTPKKQKKSGSSFPIIVETGVLTNKIIGEIRAALPTMNIIQVDTNKVGNSEESSKTTPVKIEIIETDSQGARIEKTFRVGDNTAAVGEKRVTSEIIIRGEKIQADVKVAIEVVATDCQTSAIETEYLRNNVVEGNTILENLEAAASSIGFRTLSTNSTLIVAKVEEEICQDGKIIK